MKKIIYLFAISIFLMGCESDDKLSGGNADSGWIQYDTEATNLEADSDPIELPISLPYGINKEGLTITYQVTALVGNAPASLLGTFTTKLNASEDTGSILVTPVNNGEYYQLLYTLTKSSNPDYLIGLSDGSKVTKHIVTVFDVKTSYTGDTSSVDISLPAGTFPAFTSTFTAVDGEINMWTLDTTWGPDFVNLLSGGGAPPGSFPYPSTLTLNDDLTVTITSTEAYATGGEGTYDPITDTFTLNLTQGVFNNPFTADVILN